jgi:hypothetical protein
MSSSYHGIQPPSTTDKKMAKKHLKNTEDLLEDKIDDHESAKEDAQESGNKASVKYNDSHLQGHKKDLQKVETSLDTLKKLKDKPAVIMPVKKSAGLTGFVTKKKLMSKAIAGAS